MPPDYLARAAHPDAARTEPDDQRGQPSLPLPPDAPQERSTGCGAQWWRAAVMEEERRGELLGAVDVAERGLAEHPGDAGLMYRATLALARAGATDEARRRFDEYRLAELDSEDTGSLRARLEKDIALAHAGSARRRLALHAAGLYDAVFAATGGYYPAINAATLWLIAGDRRAARSRARLVLGLLAAGTEDTYYEAATAAEAYLLLGEPQHAEAALRLAAGRHGGDYAALASTRRQLRLICETLDLDPALLAPLAGPGVVHYCGHRIAVAEHPGRFDAGDEERLAARCAMVVARRPAGFAYGALAGGADILWAEALLESGCELHVVLPFAHREFIELSVAPCGGGWVARFERCLREATSVKYATDDAYLGDDILFRYGSELAMGLALLRARYLDAEAWQLALWDGEARSGAAGTAIDVATWQRTGHAATILSPAGEISAAPGGRDSRTPTSTRSEPRTGRIVGAMLFGDARGFSRLTDAQLATFAREFLGALAAIINRYRGEISYRNTWGDAIFLVLADASVAARCALELQDAVSGLDLPALGLPAHLALRLGGHLGPILPAHDPVIDTTVFFGTHVSRTARIEPITPPGAVYVTEPFAAALTLAGDRDHRCDYVGHMPLAKDFGTTRMYRLRRAQATAAAIDATHASH